ncbi:unnamed protein product [Zymoseptoria tritici ST99CH_3D7]|uniref:Uncharacterized protein n=1 Tax=Zymoseptoria tritici (strain ST99CH_3D7) TaxID=1276538 RepID=A0A1X7RSA8_ZYMT9|nr:unnamed protein product [Zymoseptoria tritici ST99CH_3D7]
MSDIPNSSDNTSSIMDEDVRTAYDAKLEELLVERLERITHNNFRSGASIASLIMNHLEIGMDHYTLLHYLERSVRLTNRASEIEDIVLWLFTKAQYEAFNATLADALPFAIAPAEVESTVYKPDLECVLVSTWDQDINCPLPEQRRSHSDQHKRSASTASSDGSSESEEGDMLIAEEEF